MVQGGWRALAPALLVAAVLAGCAAPQETVVEDEQVKQEIVDEAGPVAEGATVGRVAGEVLHASGFPLPDARVTILSVERSVVTDANGTFRFPEVAPGQQTIRIEKPNYKTLQQTVTVEAGKLTKLEIVLLPPEGAQGGFSDHAHNLWKGAETFQVFQGTLPWQGVEARPPHMCAVTYDASCYYLYIVPEQGQLIPPGTTKVSFNVSFEPGATFEHEAVYFQAVPPRPPDGDYHSFSQKIMSGETYMEYEIPDPALVDHGHARWTAWSFYIYWTQANGPYPASGYGYLTGGDVYNELFRSPVDVTITAHKGTLPLDPPHPRFWQDTDTLELEGTDPINVYCSQAAVANCGARDPNSYVYPYGDYAWCFSYCMSLAPGHIVPPGTTKVEFTVEHWYANHLGPTQGILDEDDFVIGYKTAEAPPKRATWADYTWLEPIGTEATDRGIAWTFEAPVDSDQVDTYYSRITEWMLYPAVRGHEEAETWRDMGCGWEICGYPYFELTRFAAINEDRDAAMAGDGAEGA